MGNDDPPSLAGGVGFEVRTAGVVEDHGPAEALRVVELEEAGGHVATVTEWLKTHIENLTGVRAATVNRYRTYLRRDTDPVFGGLRHSSITVTTGTYVEVIEAVQRDALDSVATLFEQVGDESSARLSSRLSSNARKSGP